MKPLSHAFPEKAAEGLANPNLQKALLKLKGEFREKRTRTIARLPEYEALRDRGTAIKNHVLDHLDQYLTEFESAAKDAGASVHWCGSPADARDAVLQICRDAGARTVTKGKSMIGEEIALNDHLFEHGMIPVETDLGEYIIQLRGEPPSHITSPAVHLTKDQVSAAFRDSHPQFDADRPLEEPRALLDEARNVLRSSFLAADVGITGANFLIADSGSVVIVTNEGNGDLTHTVPKTHIVLASIEKLVPTRDDALTMIRLLGRSATAQEITSYTTFLSGPRRSSDTDGPENLHIVMLDNGRSDLLGGEFRDVLRCIRCGACQSLCPVYGAVGGHAYGWVYAGPVGAVLTPALIGLDAAHHLPEASSFCGTCEAVCPMQIPLPDMMRTWRAHAYERGLTPARGRVGMALWGWAARRPVAYRWLVRRPAALLGLFAGKRGRLARFPFAGGWTRKRDFPAPARRGFVDQWAARQKAHIGDRARDNRT